MKPLLAKTPMLKNKVIYAFNSSSESLSMLYKNLYADQEKSWLHLQQGIAALSEVRYRTLQCDGYMVRLQFNPRRFQSTSAQVDAISIKRRKCFLCMENLPEEQKGVLYGDEFLLLCNPAPIFHHHGTIVHIHHIPQVIEDSLPDFLNLSKDLGPKYTLFYNGPLCGASAPDHLHFQVSPAGMIPVEQEIGDTKRSEQILSTDGVKLSTLKKYGRPILIIEAAERASLHKMFLRWTSAIRKVLVVADEPLLNVICSYSNNGWRCILIPRKKHRPDVYFKNGEAQIMVSPASVDMGGLVVIPREEDYDKITAGVIQDIFLAK
jgi:hypothetical protein